MKYTFPLISILFIVFFGCSKDNSESPSPEYGTSNIVISSQTITPSFVGIGPQWGGYDNVQSWTGSATLSDNDWNTLFTRLRYMQPSLMRIMVSEGWNYTPTNFNKGASLLFKMLDFCQNNNISVIYGEWGHQGGTAIDTTWLNTSVSFYEY